MKSAIIRRHRLPELVPWPVEVSQLLEEHHMCAWSHSRAGRERFAHELAWHLSSFDDTQVCEIAGARISGIGSFCDQLERAIGFDHIERRIDTSDGVVGTLRQRMSVPGVRPIKRRFYIWSDADVLLKADHQLFGRLVDAIVGVAAESEFVSEDLLLLQRAVFVGGPSLDMYADDTRGQFRNWWSDEGENPLWRVVSGVERPRVLRYRIGDEVAGN